MGAMWSNVHLNWYQSLITENDNGGTDIDNGFVSNVQDPGLVYLSSPTAFTHAVGHGDLKRCQSVYEHC